MEGRGEAAAGLTAVVAVPVFHGTVVVFQSYKAGNTAESLPASPSLGPREGNTPTTRPWGAQHRSQVDHAFILAEQR